MTNHQITFNPNGGDLGRAEFKNISPIEFMLVMPHVAHILECLYLMGNSRLPFKYAFEFLPLYKKEFELIMLRSKLPEHVKFYELDGKRMFEIRGVSGGVASNMICYLITKEK
jgi:hypothetical protein